MQPVTRNGKARKLKKDLTLMQLRAANHGRVETLHGINDWSVLEWAGAMAGEAGEACNVAKKIKRVQTNIAKNKKEYRQDLTAQLAEECADTLIYLDLLCLRQGINLADAVRRKFNKVSRRYGFPQRL